MCLLSEDEVILFPGRSLCTDPRLRLSLHTLALHVE